MSNKIIPYPLKHLYAYFCWFGPNTNVEWNFRLAKRFGVSRSTIKRRLRRLRQLRLIWVTSGGGRHRRIHAHFFRGISDWFSFRAMPASTVTELSKRKKDLNAERNRQLASLRFFSD